uniref:Uncharacterized protein n=1 Tax=Cacopsylla melanoneura TaxID=428564 RepID=A0A8D8YPQ5_9HEMI
MRIQVEGSSRSPASGMWRFVNSRRIVMLRLPVKLKLKSKEKIQKNHRASRRRRKTRKQKNSKPNVSDTSRKKRCDVKKHVIKRPAPQQPQVKIRRRPRQLLKKNRSYL